MPKRQDRLRTLRLTESSVLDEIKKSGFVNELRNRPHTCGRCLRLNDAIFFAP